MPSHRTPRVAEAIREVVASSILFETADPRVRGVTVLKVEVTGDLRNATVFVSIMGDEAARGQAMRGLKSAAGFLQARVAARLQTRFTPVLAFKLDDSVRKSVEMSRLIDETLAADRLAQGVPESAKPLNQDAPDPDDQDEVDDRIDDDEPDPRP
jgi:ribosome-binding factor A